jgi:hypothetical protein
VVGEEEEEEAGKGKGKGKGKGREEEGREERDGKWMGWGFVEGRGMADKERTLGPRVRRGEGA